MPPAEMAPSNPPSLWLERALWTAGLALGLWAAILYLQHAYYARLPGPTLAGQAERTLPGEGPSGGVRDNARPLRRGTWLARLEAPSVQMTATVLEGSDDRTLNRAAGHIEYTPRPGEPGNVGIAGHRDTTFYPIRNLRVGDPLRLTTSDRTYEYKVTRTWVVEPEDVEVLDPTGHPSLTLVTCYPFNFLGTAPKRFIVRADLISEEGRAILN